MPCLRGRTYCESKARIIRPSIPFVQALRSRCLSVGTVSGSRSGHWGRHQGSLQHDQKCHAKPAAANRRLSRRHGVCRLALTVYVDELGGDACNNKLKVPHPLWYGRRIQTRPFLLHSTAAGPMVATSCWRILRNRRLICRCHTCCMLEARTTTSAFRSCFSCGSTGFGSARPGDSMPRDSNIGMALAGEFCVAAWL
jgi:hypothetical protein